MSELRDLAAKSRQMLAEGQQALIASWRAHKDGMLLLAGRAKLVDSVLCEIWQTF
jgi:hypothetical protein